MKKQLLIICLLFFTNILIANSERALYVKQYKNESKTALIIGNSHYKYFSKLKNSGNDASDMRDVLSSRGFDVL